MSGQSDDAGKPGNSIATTGAPVIEHEPTQDHGAERSSETGAGYRGFAGGASWDDFDDGTGQNHDFRPGNDGLAPEEEPLHHHDMPVEDLPSHFCTLISNVMNPIIGQGGINAESAGQGGGLPWANSSARRKNKAAQIARAVEESAAVFSEQASKFQLSSKLLQQTLNQTQAYRVWQDSVQAYAEARGESVQHVRDLISDPTQVSGEIRKMREDITAILKDPVIAPMFEDVERSFQISNESLSRIRGGIDALHGIKGVDISGLARVDAIVADMAARTPDAPISRPGGTRMDGPGNEMRDRLKDLAERVGELVRMIVNLARAAVGVQKGASPSPSLS